MTSGRWDVGVRTDRVRFEHITAPGTIKSLLQQRTPRLRADFCWVPSGGMEPAEQKGMIRASASTSLVRESHAVDVQLSGGVTKPLRRSFIHFSIDGKVSQKGHVETPLRPRYAKLVGLREHKALQESQRYGLLVLSSGARTDSAMVSTSLIDDAGSGTDLWRTVDLLLTRR